MTKLDENKIINIFQTKLGNKKFISEDVEIFTLGKTKIIAKTGTKRIVKKDLYKYPLPSVSRCST